MLDLKEFKKSGELEIKETRVQIPNLEIPSLQHHSGEPCSFKEYIEEFIFDPYIIRNVIFHLKQEDIGDDAANEIKEKLSAQLVEYSKPPLPEIRNSNGELWDGTWPTIEELRKSFEGEISRLIPESVYQKIQEIIHQYESPEQFPEGFVQQRRAIEIAIEDMGYDKDQVVEAIGAAMQRKREEISARELLDSLPPEIMEGIEKRPPRGLCQHMKKAMEEARMQALGFREIDLGL